jgi:large repetitive protein
VVPPAPVVQARSVDTMTGVPVRIDLTEGASGGPYTGAEVLSIVPAAAGSARVVVAGSGISARYFLEFLPAPQFSGVAVLRYTLSNGFGASTPAEIRVQVAPRPDPTRDPEVLGLMQAQADTARRFADAQIDNFQRRMESLHRNDARGLSNRLGFVARHRCMPRIGAPPGAECDDADWTQSASEMTSNEPDRDPPANLGLWIAGTVRSGDRDATGTRRALDFETQGVSAGADLRLSERFALGAGLGYGRDRTEIGTADTRSDARAYTVAAYASYHPGAVFFLDGLLGYQRLDYDLRRSLDANDGSVRGRRDGRQWFASLTTGAELGEAPWRFVPYARFDASRARLDGYTEIGDALYALRYERMDVDADSGSLGLRVEYRRRTGWGVISPQLRLEYQRDFDGAGVGVLRYADLDGGLLYRVDLGDIDRDRFGLGLGAVFDFDNDWSIRIDYLGQRSGDLSDNGVMLLFEKRR